MSTRGLDAVFNPGSILIVGASEREGNLGGAVLKQLQVNKFPGTLLTINQKPYKSVFGVPCYAKFGLVKQPVDLAILCTPLPGVSKAIKHLDKMGVKAAIILSSSAGQRQLKETQAEVKNIRKLMIKKHNIRLFGPDSIGVIVPQAKLNASYMHADMTAGPTAYIGQSSMLGAAMLEWARSEKIGFSHFLTLPGETDVEINDVVDYLGNDNKVKTLLIQLNNIQHPRKLLRAIRAVSRKKVVLVMKNNRFPQGQLIPESIPVGIRSKDQVHEAALRRSGVLRVDSTDEFFDAVQTLTKMKPLRGKRLAIVANGEGTATLALDRLLHDGGNPAVLSETTEKELKKLMPRGWSVSNPIDLYVDADASLYQKVLHILEQDRAVDAVLVLHAPSLIGQGVRTAEVLVEHARSSRKNILASWMGGAQAEQAIDVLHHGGVATYQTPDKAAKAFMHMVRHKLNQEVLMQTPAALIKLSPGGQQRANALIGQVWGQGRDYLTTLEARNVFDAYGIKMVKTEFAIDVDQLALKAQEVGYPIALKIVHQEYCHPFAYGKHSNDRWRGVATNVQNEGQLRVKGRQLFDQVCEKYPLSKVLGYSVQTMRRAVDLQQFSVGITRDSEYGPLILFGGGGGRTDIMVDRQLALPPLNSALAITLMKKSHAYYVLKEKSLQFDEDVRQLGKVLVSLSHMVIDLPYIKGCEANLLLHPDDGLITLGVAINLAEPQRMTIRPYPVGLEETVMLRKSKSEVLLRPIQGEDEPLLADFYKALSPESLRYRFFSSRTTFVHKDLAQFAQIDYDREMAFVAISESSKGTRLLGVVRIYTDADDIETEFSVIAADDLKGEGLGQLLMQKILDYARDRGIETMTGTVLPNNKPMLRLAERLGFSSKFNRQDNLMYLNLVLGK